VVVRRVKKFHLSRLVATTVLSATLLHLAGCAQEEVSEPAYDLLIRGGTVVDGSGEAGFQADVAIRGDRIVRVDRNGIPADEAAQVLSAEGLVVAPGFIDNHAHIQTTIHQHPLAENFTRQGITSILASLHSGDQPWPLDEYMASLEVAPNVGFFAGHTWIRKRVLGMENRAPNAEELEEMKGLVAEAMEHGALGLSTGLSYIPAKYADTEELIELAKVAARYGGIYSSHIRDEATGVLESVEEVIRISTEAGLPGQIQHHKVRGEPQWGWSEKTLAMIDSARARGLDIKHDFYPYTGSSSGSRVLFPEWARVGGASSLAARLADPETRARLEPEMRNFFLYVRTGNDIARIKFRSVPSDPRYEGKTLADLAADRGLPITVDSGVQLVIELQLKGGFDMIYHSMNEEDVKRIMRHPYAMVCTDGNPEGYGLGHPHPRSYGTFPRVLGRYVRELNVLTLEEAIRRMTSLSAEQIGQHERGRIAENMYADVTVFDPETIEDLATYMVPHQYSIGIRHVVVNGVLVMRNGALTGAKPGRVLKGPARPEADGT